MASRLWDREQVAEGVDKSSTSLRVAGAWDDTALGSADAPGAIIAGTVKSVRNLSIQDGAAEYHRYVAIVVHVTNVLRRRFDDGGAEIEPGKKERKRVGQGYLNVYETTAAEHDTIPVEAFHAAVAAVCDLLMPTGTRADLHPRAPACLEFWGRVDVLRPLDLKPDVPVRFKTRHDSHIIETCTRLGGAGGAAAQPYSGESFMDSWTDKLGAAPTAAAPQDDKEGVDEDEWGDE